MPHPRELEIDARLRHPVVRDLAWLLQAPDLLDTPYPGRPRLGELALDDPERRQAWLRALEQQPGELEQAVAHRLGGRLGLYHEALWHFLIARAPGTRLLATNLAIRDARGVTLGELDLLYRRRGDAAVVHLELAIKYYLGLETGPGGSTAPARWIGPGCADSLAIKSRRALTHQLTMSRRPEARERLAAYGDADVERRLALLGVLFRPVVTHDGNALPLPHGTTADALIGEWLPLSAWARHSGGLAAPVRGAFLDKPHWLAPPPDDRLMPLGALTGALLARFRARRTPCQLTLREADGARRRVFVVPDGWPHLIPLMPR
ncbi:DUF1853 family protein [Modicisalibacter tunisiensis]|uniref:DUF1853 family protein n=1 Tax=Modicisalibacter tunisiensis TaxID=390637 RepID=A0ABS7X3Q7_9GAMM|nr:DUF1853 family protein [Modicisalibacter tunisiensis]MBZ9537479.1 DUF1853 family protein [Modicisalibacter tunisiensis]MBZ9569099.1 DUF1853 family protein [Modicisalibacter tunisiensis]